MSDHAAEVPRGDAAGFAKYLKSDIQSGFLVFLLALPLCLGIAIASGYPAIAGVFTAVVGGLITPWLSNSELTIKGAPAGLIVITLGAITEMKEIDAGSAYQLALGIGVAAGVVQILFGLSRSGILGEFFPISVVHGMLAAIGVIIISKQVHVTLGVMGVKGEAFELIGKIPDSIRHMNPEIAIIGLISLAIMFIKPMIKNKYIKMVPAPLIVIFVAVPLGMLFHVETTHSYVLAGQNYELSDKYLVNVPGNLFKAMAFPDFRGLATPAGWKWVVLFSLIGTLESLLSAKAIDSLDPYKRKTDMNRELLAIGVANTAVSFIGGMPMISEIVRSKANVDNGGKTRFANMFHGVFLLLFVALVPGLIHMIPLAALSAMLVYTGTRLASPKEFQDVFRIGKEQLVIFVSTLVGVLATDLLIGVAIGIGVKFAIHMINGVPFNQFFKPFLDIEEHADGSTIIKARGSAVFSNWILFKKQIEHIGLVQRSDLTIDLSGTKLVDHSVMEKLHELEDEFHREGLKLHIIGLENHQPLSSHSLATRKRGASQYRRATIVIDAGHKLAVMEALADLGISDFTAMSCEGSLANGHPGSHVRHDLVKLEIVTSLINANLAIESVKKVLGEDTPSSISLETIDMVPSGRF